MPLPPRADAAAADLVEAFNANVDKLNARIFTSSTTRSSGLAERAMKPLRVLSAMASSTLAAAFFLTLLASLTSVPGMPLLALAGLAGLVVLALVRPDHALVALAIGIPIASWVGRQVTPGVAWPEALAVAFCAGYCARGIRIPRREPAPSADALAPPLFVAVAVVVASLVLQLLVDAWRFGEASTMAELWRLMRSGYSSRRLRPIRSTPPCGCWNRSFSSAPR